MWKIYEKQPVWFAVGWILIYCILAASVRGSFGDESPWMLLCLLAIAAALTAFILANRLGESMGMTRWPKKTGRYLFFLPMWLLTTGNLWGGIAPAGAGWGQVFAVLSMALVGYVEEAIFRGLLFRAMARESLSRAVVISAITFGIGHIVNLLTGQASLETVAQVFFAIAWGFVFTFVYLKSGSLLPGILAHVLVDVFSRFAVQNAAMDRVYIIATIALGAAYSLWLSRQENGLAVEERTP